MKSRSYREVQVVQVAVMVHGDTVQLLDLDGRTITKRIRSERIATELSEEFGIRLQWVSTAARIIGTMDARKHRKNSTPWQRKARSLCVSAVLRAKDITRVRSRSFFSGKYPTSTWEAAATRMAEQGLSAARYHSRTGWARWSQSVANNSNKRKGGRYAHAKTNHGQADTPTR